MESRDWLILCIVLLTKSCKVFAQCSGSALDIQLSTTYQISVLTYPTSGSYTENLDCTWNLISSNPSTEDVLMFIQIAQIRNNDILTIYDGTTSSTLFVSSSTGASGQSLSTVALSGTGIINFVSDGNAEANQNGFTISYMSASSNDVGGCSSAATLTATDTLQYVTSKNFPSTYPSNSNCAWTINAQDSCGTLVLDFIVIDLENDCSIDKVSVTYDGNPTVDLCPSTDWNSNSDYTTTGTSATLAMVSDGSEEQQGFVMSYVRTGCTTTTVTTTTGTTTTSTNHQQTSSTNTGAIVGGTIGGVAGVAGITAAVLYAKGFIGPKGLKGAVQSNPGATKKGTPNDIENTGTDSQAENTFENVPTVVENGGIPMDTHYN